jgi:hypothetical protein
MSQIHSFSAGTSEICKVKRDGNSDKSETATRTNGRFQFVVNTEANKK